MGCAELHGAGIGWGLSGMTIKSAARVNSLRRKRQFWGSVAFVLTCVLVPAVLETPAHAQQPIAFNIPAQDLNSAVLAFAQRASVRVFYDTTKLRGRQAPSVTGSMSPQDALGRLLAGSGLTYHFTSATAVTIGAQQGAGAIGAVPAGSIPLDAIDVQGASSLQDEGTAKKGYRAKTVSAVGPLGAMPLQDTPFTVSVIPRELIQNIQAQSPDDIYKLNPSTRTSTPQVTTWTPVVIVRGFRTSGIAHDGLRRSTNHAAVLEDKERVEIFSGPTGFLYGATPPGGMINFVYKRPTKEIFNSVTAGNYGGSQAFVHGDFGGPIDPSGKAGYRLNVVKQGGNTVIDDQSIDRVLVSGAFDWQASEKLKLELNAVYNKYETRGSSAYWFHGPTITRGPAPDASKNWGQPWIKDQMENLMLMGKLTYQLSDSITFRGAYMRDFVDRPVQEHTQNSMRPNNTYVQLRLRTGDTRSIYDSAQALSDIEFNTGFAKHKVTTGYYMTSERFWASPYSANTGYVGPYPINGGPTYVPPYNFPPDTSSPYYAGATRNHNFMVGDLIEFGQQWSLLAGLNYSRITDEILNQAGQLAQPAYAEGRISPSISVMYKPVPWLTTYASYIEGLEQGGVAPIGTTNQRAVMAPMVSQQKEVGIKATVDGLFLTAALFDIEKAYEFTNSMNTYTQDGRQRHKGVEFSATGKMTDRLTIVGGVTLLDAKVINSAYDGKIPMNVASTVAKLYSEYEFPFTSGLFLTGGIYYTSAQWGNATNLDRVPAYTTVDLGARYETKIHNNPLTLRLNVSNIENKSYWLNSYYVGKPRTVAFSAQMRF